MTDNKQNFINKLALFIVAILFVILIIVIVKAIKYTARNIKDDIQTRQEEKRLD